MKHVPIELGDLTNWVPFREYHAACGATFDDDLKRFLNATMDEVRTSASTRLAISILDIIGISDFGLFRDAVLRRELTGTIAYAKQRDHSSHTVYNYLLGWYFYRHCSIFADALAVEFQRRGVGRAKGLEPFSSDRRYFGAVWKYVTILHDIGYMFEGGLPILDFRDSHEQALIGCNVAHRYFNRGMWLEYKLNSIPLRSQLFKALGDSIRPPLFNSLRTLAEIADGLRFLGDDVDVLQAAVCNDLVRGGVRDVPYPDLNDLSCDAFELWTQHYERFDNDRMANRIKCVQNIFNVFIDVGIPGIDVRLLEHGVCSGLLVNLMAATYYYRLYAKASALSKPPLAVQRFLHGRSWSPAFWWTGIVWATAATAIHNVQQMDTLTSVDASWPGPISLEEDPIAYLGILADVLDSRVPSSRLLSDGP